MLPVMAMAQSSLGYNTRKYSGMRLTPGQTVTDGRRTGNLDIENSAVYAARDLGAIVDFMYTRADSTSFASMLHRDESNIVDVSFSNVNNSGEYLHYDGSRNTFGNIVAGGELHLKNAGTLYGMAAYSNGGSRGISLSYALHPEDVAPYFVSDSLGASTMHREIYTVSGGYSFSLSNMELGIDALYEGIAQSRNHDPRHTNYSHLLRLGFSAAKVWHSDIAGIKVMPEWSRQSISANSMLDGLKFFDFYGFGLYNRRESQSAITYGRQQTIRGVGAQAMYMHSGSWDVTLNAGWRYRRLNTEEYNFKDLFASTTNHLWEQAIATHRSGQWMTTLQLSAAQQKRKGEENVYEQQVQDKDQGLYDYVKVGTNKLYSLTIYNADLRLKEAYFITPATSVFALGAATWQHYEEKYDSPVRSIKNQTMTATVAAGINHKGSKVELEGELHAATQGGWDNKYSLTGSMNDFQRIMAFTPYQLRGENHQVLGASFVGSHKLGKGLAIGIKASVDYLNSDYRKQVAMETGVFMTF